MILQARAEAVDFASSQSSLSNNSGHADRELQRRVHNFLQNRGVPHSSSVDVEAHNGVVTLRGTHRSFYHKQLCINRCQRVAGVVRLIDATKVLPAR
jgi:osmotically-inducible protein OsmY